jgi:hypothetical protein
LAQFFKLTSWWHDHLSQPASKKHLAAAIGDLHNNHQ